MKKKALESIHGSQKSHVRASGSGVCPAKFLFIVLCQEISLSVCSRLVHGVCVLWIYAQAYIWIYTHRFLVLIITQCMDWVIVSKHKYACYDFSEFVCMILQKGMIVPCYLDNYLQLRQVSVHNFMVQLPKLKSRYLYQMSFIVMKLSSHFMKLHHSFFLPCQQN